MKMKQGFLCLLSCLAMVVTFLPGAALAAGDSSSGIVAKVGNMEFSSLADAVAAIVSTEDKTGTVEIVGDVEMNERITVPSGAVIKLIDNGVKHSITMNSATEKKSQKAAFIVE